MDAKGKKVRLTEKETNILKYLYRAGAKPVSRKVPYSVAFGAAFLMELAGHVLHTKKPPLATRYAVWLIGRRCFFSCEKARKELGWQPAVSYDEGIERSVRWCLEHVAGL